MKITKLVRQIAVASATSTATTLTVVTTGNHNLVTGDLISFDANARLNHVVTVVNATTFTVGAIYHGESSNPFTPTLLVFSLELNASALTTVPVPLGATNDSAATFQLIGKTTAGAGSAVVNIEVSNNGVNWLTFATITITLGTTDVSDGVVLTAPWGYVKATATTLTGTGAKVSVLMGRSS